MRSTARAICLMRSAAPRPDRRADEVHRANALPAQLFLERQVEIRRVDADEHLRLRRDHALAQRATKTQQARQMAQHLDVAAHRQLAHVVPRFESRSDHAVAADAGAVHDRARAADFGNYGRCKQIAGCLARDERDRAFARH